MQKQNKGVIPVDLSYSSTSCSSALLASASLDTNSITYKTTKGNNKKIRYKVKSFVCRIVLGRFLENREDRLTPWRWRIHISNRQWISTAHPV